jgi:hypothetical protein
MAYHQLWSVAQVDAHEINRILDPNGTLPGRPEVDGKLPVHQHLLLFEKWPVTHEDNLMPFREVMGKTVTHHNP